MLYRFLKIIVGLGTRLYYREIKIKNADFLENDGPIIIIANHPNTMMDGWIISFASRKPIYFLAKATFFNSPIKKWFLGTLNMIPINRTADSATSGVSNTNSFEACYKVLEEGKILLIFPEGNSILERQLRELKSGTARIALEAENRNNGNLNLKVVPIGLFYSKAEKFRSSILVNTEQGITVNDYLEEYKEDSKSAVKKLTTKFRLHLERVLLTTDSTEQEQLIESLFSIIKDPEKSKDVQENVELMQKIHDRIEEIQLVQPYLLEEIQDSVNAINWQSEKLKIKTESVKKRFKSNAFISQLLVSLVMVLLGLPVFVYGFIFSYLPFKATDLIMPKLVKSVEYYAPVAVLIGLVLYPINYVGFLFLVDWLFDLNTLLEVLFFCSLPLSGMFAYQFALFIQKIAYKWKYLFLVINEKEAIKELRVLHKKLETLLFE